MDIDAPQKPSKDSRIHVPDVEKGIVDVSGDVDEEDAKRYLPLDVSGVSLHKDTTWHFRWKVTYLKKKDPPFSTSQVWLKKGEVCEIVESCKNALLHCLTWVWDEHERETGAICPYQFE